MNFPEAAESLERDVLAGRYSGYLPRPIPHELDQLVVMFLQSYLDADSPEPPLLQGLSPTISRVLLAFGERQASLAIRTNSHAALEQSAVAIGLAAALIDDETEGTMVMPLPWHAAVLLQVHPQHLFSGSAARVPEAGARALLAFAARPPEDQTLQCMGYVEGVDSNGFRFERTW